MLRFGVCSARLKVDLVATSLQAAPWRRSALNSRTAGWRVLLNS